jgi:hypothetical protein
VATGNSERLLKRGPFGTGRQTPASASIYQKSFASTDIIPYERRLVLPKRIDMWSLTSLQQRLVKTGGRLVKHMPATTGFASLRVI